MKNFLILISFLALSFGTTLEVLAQESEESFKGIIEEIFEVPCSEVLEEGYVCFEYTVNISDLEKTVRTIPILSENGESRFFVGDGVYISYLTDGYDYESWSITGFVREGNILMIVIIFSIVAILIGGRQGLGSLFGLGISVLLLYLWAIPSILNGADVLLIGSITVCISLVSIVYISHGFNLKSTIAILSTLIGVLIVAILAKIFIGLIRIDGSGSEEAFLLASQTGGSVDLAGIFFVSILIGAVGVLDDVVISQVSAIQELSIANPNLTLKKLFSQAMNIGRDHISSMVNTLFIAYAGSSFALVILLTYNSGSVGSILRTDAIAEEIVRTFSASIGILLVVPITTFIASYVVLSRQQRQ